jgi:hypothetical protein
MAVQYKSSSNYSSTAINKKYLEYYKPNITSNTLDENVRKIIIPSTYNLRPDLLAYNLYGTSRAWWVFAHYNRDQLKDPVFDFKAGLEIIVPNTFTPVGN